MLGCLDQVTLGAGTKKEYDDDAAVVVTSVGMAGEDPGSSVLIPDKRQASTGLQQSSDRCPFPRHRLLM
jgi:hypothetical protein